MLFVIAFSSFRCLYIKVYILFSSTLNARVLTSHFSSSNQSPHLEVHWSSFLYTNQTALLLFDRMDNMRHHVDKLAVLVSSSRKEESLYKEAFRRRCHDLWKAETEVLNSSYNVLVLSCFSN